MGVLKDIFMSKFSYKYALNLMLHSFGVVNHVILLVTWVTPKFG